MRTKQDQTSNFYIFNIYLLDVLFDKNNYYLLIKIIKFDVFDEFKFKMADFIAFIRPH